ncbi:MAG: carotenoid biosynthesis protein [bacterium]|nr:carotenoid biosynthesis protein [bacterium]
MLQDYIKLIAPIASAVAIIAFAVPAYVSVVKQKGMAKGPLILLILGLFALVVEGVSIKTGLPYGDFEYGSSIGFKLFGLVPWPVAFAYPPILIGAFWSASKITKGMWRVPLTALFALIVDVVIDPALTKMGIWVWESPGQFYGVPLLNFAGWLITGVVGAMILNYLWGEAEVKRGMVASAFAIVLFWSGINLGLQQWIPGIIGMVVGILILFCMMIERKREKKAAA